MEDPADRYARERAQKLLSKQTASRVAKQELDRQVDIMTRRPPTQQVGTQQQQQQCGSHWGPWRRWFVRAPACAYNSRLHGVRDGAARMRNRGLRGRPPELTRGTSHVSIGPLKSSCVSVCATPCAGDGQGCADHPGALPRPYGAQAAAAGRAHPPEAAESHGKQRAVRGHAGPATYSPRAL